MRREGGERCRAIFKSEIREIELDKTIAIKRLWRLLKKIRMRESSLQMLLGNMARKARTSLRRAPLHSTSCPSVMWRCDMSVSMRRWAMRSKGARNSGQVARRYSFMAPTVLQRADLHRYSAKAQSVCADLTEKHAPSSALTAGYFLGPCPVQS